jgi:hypothetical protein
MCAWLVLLPAECLVSRQTPSRLQTPFKIAMLECVRPQAQLEGHCLFLLGLTLQTKVSVSLGSTYTLWAVG